MKLIKLLFVAALLIGCVSSPNRTGTAVIEMTETSAGPVFKVYAYYNYSEFVRISYNKVTDDNSNELPFIANHKHRCNADYCINRDVLTVSVPTDIVTQYRDGFTLTAQTLNHGPIHFFVAGKNINNLFAATN